MGASMTGTPAIDGHRIGVASTPIRSRAATVDLRSGVRSVVNLFLPLVEASYGLPLVGDRASEGSHFFQQEGSVVHRRRSDHNSEGIGLSPRRLGLLCYALRLDLGGLRSGYSVEGFLSLTPFPGS